MKPKLTWLISMLAILMLAIAGWQWWQSMQLQRAIDTRLHELSAAQQQRVQTLRDGDWWRQHEADYQRLLATGFIGEDARVDWHQALSRASKLTGVHHAEFDIAAQVPHQPEVKIGQRLLRDSIVHWRGEVAHEDVLVTLLAQLSQAGHGLFSVRSCTLSHADEQALIGVDCEFSWQVLS
ncbi:MAG: hypothetical protein HOP20_02925 [Sulfuriferula sp.]|nr:hypothetical protein [Sulfuriferula sp.]